MTVLSIKALNKELRSKKKKKKFIDNHDHNTLRLFDVSPTFRFITSEIERDY